MKKAIIFDLDGVIVFTDRYHYQAWKRVSDKLGIYFDEEINNRLRGVSRMESLNIILEKSEKTYSDEEKKELAEEKNIIYRNLLKNMKPSDVTGEVKETLQRLRKSGFQLAIGSSSKNAGYILEKVELAGLFDAVSDGTNNSNSKPHPEVFLKAASLLNRTPDECIVVEDAHAGIIAAKAAGMTAVGIGDAVQCKETDYKLSNISDLLMINF